MNDTERNQTMKRWLFLMSYELITTIVVISYMPVLAIRHIINAIAEWRINPIRSELEAKIQARIEADIEGLQQMIDANKDDVNISEEERKQRRTQRLFAAMINWHKTRDIGYCHIYWGIQKEILKKDYGIHWKTPRELNPYTRYD